MSNHEDPREVKTTLIVLFGVFLLAAFGIVNTLDKRSEQNQASLYCEMVAEYKASNGKHGWPAYKGEMQCQ